MMHGALLAHLEVLQSLLMSHCHQNKLLSHL